MGQVQSSYGENESIEFAVSTRKGLHPCMEDAHTAMLDLRSDDPQPTAFFGVYDGHGGADVALYCANRFHTELVTDVDYQNSLPEALNHVFSSMDAQLQQNDEWRALANPPRFGIRSLCFPTPSVQGAPYMEGSTACVALIRGNQIIVGNVGDSRCILSRRNEIMAANLSTEHLPSHPDEQARIEAAGGEVAEVQPGDFRVNGSLKISRSVGDFQLKPPSTGNILICTPDIHIEEITEDTEFLIIASQPVWKSFSSDTAVKYVRHWSNSVSLSTVCAYLRNQCEDHANDVTVIVVKFKALA